MTNNAIKLLFEDLKLKFDAKSLLTFRLNMNVLENFLAKIRPEDDDPDPVEFKYSLKYCILKSKEDVSLVINDEDEDCTKETLHKNAEDMLLTQLYLGSLADTEGNIDEENMSEIDVELEDLESDSLEKIAGYICRKLNLNEPYISTSESGSIQPSNKFINCLNKLDEIFNSFNGDNLKTTNLFISILLGHSIEIECHDNIKILFFQCRLYFRIRRLNLSLQNSKISKKRKYSNT